MHDTHLLQHLSKAVLFLCRLARGALVLGVRLNPSVRVKATDYAIGFLQNPAALLEEWLDSVDEFLLVEFFFRLALS